VKVNAAHLSLDHMLSQIASVPIIFSHTAIRVTHAERFCVYTSFHLDDLDGLLDFDAQKGNIEERLRRVQVAE
jgi:hypothetical protein